MNVCKHIVESCPLNKLADDVLLQLHSADDNIRAKRRGNESFHEMTTIMTPYS